MGPGSAPPPSCLQSKPGAPSCRLAGSGGVTSGAKGGCCHPCQQLPDQSVPGWLSLSPPSPRNEGEAEAWCKGSASERAHPQGPSWASFNRFGEHCLVGCLLSCSMANPGWGEESQTIADSWVPAAARPPEQTPRAEPGPASPCVEGWGRFRLAGRLCSSWRGRAQPADLFRCRTSSIT